MKLLWGNRVIAPVQRNLAPCWYRQFALTPILERRVPLLQQQRALAKVSIYAEDLHIGRLLPKPLDVDRNTLSRYKQNVQQVHKNPWTDERAKGEYDDSVEQRGLSYEFDGLAEIHKLSFSTQVLLEIRDVRLPASTHHPSFTRLAKHRKHLICYTHADLIDGKTRNRVEEWTRKSWPKAEYRFVDTRSDRSDSADAFGDLYHWIVIENLLDANNNYALTVGVPNTGKSSVLTNLIRFARHQGHIAKGKIKGRPIQHNKKGKKVKLNLGKKTFPSVEDVPGKTRELTEYLIYQNEKGKFKKYFVDVPGLTPPSFFFRERPTAWYGMGAANLLTMPKSWAKNRPDVYLRFCDYVLYCLNRDNRFEYVRQLNLDGPSPDIQQVLLNVGKQKVNIKDENARMLKRCTTFLKLFQTGNFGPVVLDDLSKKFRDFQFRDSHFNRKPRRSKKNNDDWYDDDDDYDYRNERKSSKRVDQGGNDKDDDDWWNAQW